MNTRIVDQRTLWTVLAMESALALPIISLPTQGDRVPGLLGPLLIVLLLPLGYLAVYQLAELRDPSWRLLTGIGLALLARALVSIVPEPGPSGLMVWFGHSFVPAAIGIGLWWRGGAICVSELTPAEVPTEFSVLAACLAPVLGLARAFLLAAAQEQWGWLVALILFALLLGGALAAILGVRLLLQNWIGSPTQGDRQRVAELVVERTGTPRGDAQDVLAWLLRWLRARFARRSSHGSIEQAHAEVVGADAWEAYQHLLSWAERQGLGRRPAETTG